MSNKTVQFTVDNFDAVLGKTLHYQVVQNNISAITQQNKPYYVVEFGSGLGKTVTRLASENPTTSFVAVDFDEEFVEHCKNLKDYNKHNNVTFVLGDLTKLNTFNLVNMDMALLAYSYNYILNPLTNKEEFLKDVYRKMKRGAKILIADWFLPEEKTYNKENMEQFYLKRMEEGKLSLKNNLMLENPELTDEVQQNIESQLAVYEEYHQAALKKLLARKEIFPTSKKWLLDTAEKIGFKLELVEELNTIGDIVVLLSK